MYIGPFYINTKELFLILAVFFLAFSLRFGWNLYWFDTKTLLFIVLLLFVTKTVIPTIQNEAFFILAIITIFLTLYFSWFQILIFYFVSFAFFRWLKLI